MKQKKEKKKRKWWVAVVVVVVLFVVFGGGSDESASADVAANETKVEATSKAADKVAAADTATLGEKNALKAAYSYLDYSAFSYKGLVEQLEFEGYTRNEAIYAADHCGADWNEQAAKKAAQYLEYSAFSKQGLMEQLDYEGFTQKQAMYAVQQVGY